MWFRAWKTMVRRVWRVARKVGGEVWGQTLEWWNWGKQVGCKDCRVFSENFVTKLRGHPRTFNESLSSDIFRCQQVSRLSAHFVFQALPWQCWRVLRRSGQAADASCCLSSSWTWGVLATYLIWRSFWENPHHHDLSPIAHQGFPVLC